MSLTLKYDNRYMDHPRCSNITNVYRDLQAQHALRFSLLSGNLFLFTFLVLIISYPVLLCPWAFCTSLHFYTWCIHFNPLNTELNPIRHLLALVGARHIVHVSRIRVNPLNAELNPIRHLLALVGARHFVHVSRITVNS